MATYELYLWEPEVDLSNQEWNETLKSIDQDDPVTIKTVIRQKIYKLYRDKEHTAVHIEKFFSCILEILNKPEYQTYFEGLSDWITEQQGYFNKSPCLVFQDEDTLANATSHEFKRALYEAIEQSGVCVYETMNGYLLPSDAIARKNIFQEIFNTYPALIPQVPRPPVTLDTVPQNVTEMKDILLAFMQQHPIGRQFEVEKVTKQFDDRKQYYGIDFKRNFKSIIINFDMMLTYDLHNKLYKINIINCIINYENQYLNEIEKKMINKNELFFNGVNVSNVFSIYLDVKYIKFNKKIDDFCFKYDANILFYDFLHQFSEFLKLLVSIGAVEDIVNLFFNSNGFFDHEVEDILNGITDKEISNGFILSLLKIAVYGEISKSYKNNLIEYLVNSSEVNSREDRKNMLNNMIKAIGAVKEHAKQKVINQP